MQVSTIKPGLLVSLSVRIRGGVNYYRQDIEADHVTETGERVAEWNTKREIANAEEYDRANVARSKARSLITSACCFSSFGLLCPVNKEEELADKIQQARTVAEQFNATAAHSRIDVYLLMGRVAQDDVEAARSIAAEMRGLLEEMQQGINAADPAAIRDAANRARMLGGMLSPDVAGKVTAAIEQARKAARDIVKRVEKAGEVAAAVVGACNTEAIDAARFAFLDTESAPVQEVAPAAVSVEFEPTRTPEAFPAPALNLEV